MALATVELGQGATLGFDTAITTESYGGISVTAIAEIVSVSAPGYVVGKEDVTHMESTTKEYRPQLVDPQEISAELHFLPTNYSTYQGLVGAGPYAWQITTDDAAGTVDGTYQFLGFCSGYTPGEFTVEGKRTASMTIQPVSDVTVVPA